VTRLSLGEEKPCDRCKEIVPPGKISTLVAGHWLCAGCWTLWQILRTQTLKETLAAFMRSKL
jgi:hypothetical protein